MSTATLQRTAAQTLSNEDVQQFLYAEARCLDDREWDQWLAFYHDDCEFWMPAWDDHDTLTEDPQNEMSLIYYPDKSGIEDRVFRIKTDRSSATSLPEPRTSHNLSNIEIISQQDGELKVRFNWLTMNYRYGKTDQHWGCSFYTIDTTGPTPLITAKKIVLKNDVIHHVIDIYHI
ncbi:benzoate 1,2-dioxygenase small subunit [Actibacterium lipolyticum]|uniref:2-halobenzoate 1,2-dioxygenase small subunit n=1 Tax=Actibacterium lipolyticum TaxID=1524263 RepID=A0A238L828_9RHOB|nr:benzoate 1,2-dioxygenase small subunit [Actibacterium lipolyticum]SMX51245.1 2-halobenzoate 1,2-dioxygenase small subunit [Actibacterium lipolyticum]